MAATISVRVRGQRIGPREVIREAQHKLLNSGCGNYLRAKYIYLLGKAVAASDSPIFFQQRANIRECPHPAWRAAYTLVFQYLEDRRLDLARATAIAECPGLDRSPTLEPHQPEDDPNALAQSAESPDPFDGGLAKSLGDLASDDDDIRCPLLRPKQDARRHLPDREMHRTGKGELAGND